MKIIGKTASFIGAVFFFFIMASCNTDVNLFADYHEMPAIYGMLDNREDTNFVRISRVIVSDEDLSAILHDPNANCYDEKLDVRLVEYRNGEKQREIVLDTLTKQLYYTTERLSRNTDNDHYSYDLIVVSDGQVLTSKTNMVGGDEFRLVSAHLNFSKQYFGFQRFVRFGPAVNAAIEAGERELLNYYHIYDETMINTQTIPDLSCVGPGATGLFSSRCRYSARGSLTGSTVPDMLDLG